MFKWRYLFFGIHEFRLHFEGSKQHLHMICNFRDH